MSMLRKLTEVDIRSFLDENIVVVQRHITDKEMIERFSSLDIVEIAFAYDKSHFRKLICYERDNGEEAWYETGICYGPGPKCKNSKNFLPEMLRFFSKKKIHAIKLTEKYYFNLIVRESFYSQI